MARRAVLGGGTLNPFGGGGVDFGAFNILNSDNEAYLAFLKVETAWNAGKATNDEYLAALRTYAGAAEPGSTDSISRNARLEQATYQVQRNVLIERIQSRNATYADLVAFDKSKLEGLVVDSQEYSQRLDLYRESQARLIADEEQKQVDKYQAGKMTTTALRAWYQAQLASGIIDRNPDLVESLTNRVTELTDRVQDEKDSQVLSDFSSGKMTTHDFLAYATAARARYATGTTQAKDWDSRISAAKESASETGLLYRYNLSQQYAELQRFVSSNAGKPAGGTSTSTSKRVVLGSDGQWHTITSTSTKSTAPSKSEIAAYQKLQVEVADAKAQMKAIAAKVSGLGGFVQSKSMLSYYQKKLGTFAKGSEEWYAVQGKIDSINDRIHQESVFAKQGVKITYPSGGGGATSAKSAGGEGTSTAAGGAKASSMVGGGGYSLAQFMRAIATQESGGSYTARNSSTGAYGKYQILPSNWSSWAQKAGLPANAPQTPENQEKVATAAFQRLAKSYGNDWSRVAAAWFAGVAGSGKGPQDWGPRTQRYVSAIMSHMGTTIAAVRGGGSSAAGAPASAGGGGAGRAVASGASTPAARPSSGSGPLAIVTGVTHGPRGGEVVHTQATGFPTNLDSRAFEKFYANYERAFENGEESFVDYSSGKAVSYWIGDDPAERIDRMRHLDDLRVNLFDERAVAYQGTASEITAMNQRNEAVKDVARHEYLIVDSATNSNSGSIKTHAQTNPLASGIRLLDKTIAAIKSNLSMANAAFDRGDITAAYSMYQEAQRLLDANGATIQNLGIYAVSSQQKLAAIEQATGIDPAEALGEGKGGTLTGDLKRLTDFGTELKGLFDEQASKRLTEIKSHVKLDAAGNAMWEDNGPNAQLQLADDAYFLLDKSGKVTLESAPPHWNAATRQNEFGDDTTVTVRVKAGTHVIQAQAKFEVAQVGAFIDPTDPNHLLPIFGKVVQQRTADGKWVSFYENPLAPGSQTGWSNKPWVFSAPQGFTAKPSPNGDGTAVYSFAYGGATYSFVFDQKKGAYSLTQSKAGGFWQPEIKDQPFGAAGDADVSALLGAAGFARSGNSEGGFDGTLMPVFGMSADEYSQWEKGFQPPAIASLNKVYGEQPSLESRDARPKPYGGLSLEDRDALAAARPVQPIRQYGETLSIENRDARHPAQPVRPYGQTLSIEDRDARDAQVRAIGGATGRALADAVGKLFASPLPKPATGSVKPAQRPDGNWLAAQAAKTKTPPAPAPAPVKKKPPASAARKSSARKPLPPKPVLPKITPPATAAVGTRKYQL